MTGSAGTPSSTNTASTARSGANCGSTIRPPITAFAGPASSLDRGPLQPADGRHPQRHRAHRAVLRGRAPCRRPRPAARGDHAHSPTSARPERLNAEARVGENSADHRLGAAFADRALRRLSLCARASGRCRARQRSGDVDRVLTRLQQEIAADGLVPAPHFAAVPVAVAVRRAASAAIGYCTGAIWHCAAASAARAIGMRSGSGASARKTMRPVVRRRIDDQPVGGGHVFVFGNLRVLLRVSSDRVRSRGVRRRDR